MSDWKKHQEYEKQNIMRLKIQEQESHFQNKAQEQIQVYNDRSLGFNSDLRVSISYKI